MRIVAVGVKNYQLPSVDISAEIVFPKITVDKARLDLPTFSLKCSKKPGESRIGVHALLQALAQSKHHLWSSRGRMHYIAIGRNRRSE